jgi:Zn-dependent peptidase ImmA (M78 family)
LGEIGRKTIQLTSLHQCKSISIAILMPKNESTLALRSRKVDMARLAALKPEWRVSMQALLYRAQSLGLIEKRKRHGYGVVLQWIEPNCENLPTWIFQPSSQES